MSGRHVAGEGAPRGAAQVEPALGARAAPAHVSLTGAGVGTAPLPVHDVDGDGVAAVLELGAGAAAVARLPVLRAHGREESLGWTTSLLRRALQRERVTVAGGGLLEAARPCLAVDPALLEHGGLPALGPGLGHRAHLLPGHEHLPAHNIAGSAANRLID